MSFWYHVNWKRNPFRDETANRVVWDEWRMRDMSRETCALFGFELARKPRAQDPLRLSRSILSCECSMNFILERNSFRNEAHSGIMWTYRRFVPRLWHVECYCSFLSHDLAQTLQHFLLNRYTESFWHCSAPSSIQESCDNESCKYDVARHQSPSSSVVKASDH